MLQTCQDLLLSDILLLHTEYHYDESTEAAILQDSSACCAFYYIKNEDLSHIYINFLLSQNQNFESNIFEAISKKRTITNDETSVK